MGSDAIIKNDLVTLVIKEDDSVIWHGFLYVRCYCIRVQYTDSLQFPLFPKSDSNCKGNKIGRRNGAGTTF